jgi:plastocyanin
VAGTLVSGFRRKDVHVPNICRALLVVAAAAAGSCGGGGGGSNAPTTPSTPSTGGNTGTTVITILPDGTMNPKEVRIDVRQQVRFVNQDTRAHQPQSNPHLVHTDCPALNAVGVLQPGDSRTTGAFDVEKVCGFHDHMNPDSPNLGGTIRVAGAEGPAGPVYIKP